MNNSRVHYKPEHTKFDCVIGLVMCQLLATLSKGNSCGVPNPYSVVKFGKCCPFRSNWSML